MSLFAHITNIRWDYDNENLVKGRMCFLHGVLSSQLMIFYSDIHEKTASGSRVKDFCLDPSMQSKYFIANYLWDSL